MIATIPSQNLLIGQQAAKSLKPGAKNAGRATRSDVTWTMFSCVAAFALIACGNGDVDDSPSSDASMADIQMSDADMQMSDAGIDPVDDDTLEVLAEYWLDGDKLLGKVEPEHQLVWERFADLFPADLRPEIKLFVAIDADASGGTDGAMQLSAANPDDYYLALDVTGSVEPDELDRTMIHEFGHLLTLRPSQVPRDESAIDSCMVFTFGDGCPAEDAYLTAYFEEFWPGYLLSDLDAEEATAADDRFETGEFVTEYAATIPTEDVAEVFAEWVLSDSTAIGDEVVAKKLRFFDDYPEVVEIRSRVRTALAP